MKATVAVMSFLALFQSMSSAPAIGTDRFEDKCQGSLVFLDSNLNKIAQVTESVKKTQIDLTDVSKIYVEGCGCFFVHNRRGYKGGSVYLDHLEHKEVNRSEVRFNKVQSIKRVKC